MAVGVHVPLRFLRAALKRGVAILKEHLPAQPHTTSKLVLEPALARLPHPQPARTKISKRYYSTSKPYNASTRPSHLRTPVRRGLVNHTATTPFASTLRPKLVGGVLPRSASGYSLGGSARYFSHTPAAPAQVLQQVSAAMRAFVYNSANKRPNSNTNGKIGVRARLASAVMENAPGAYVDFHLAPTFTRLSPLNSAGNSLQAAGFVDTLGADFGAMVGGITAVYADVQRLAQLGDLPVTVAGPAGDVLRVHFKGCDREFVELICNDFGVSRGVVHEDERFAFSPVEAYPIGNSWRDMMSDDPPEESAYSEDGYDDDHDIGLISGSESGGGSEYFYELERGVVVGTPDASAFEDGGSSGYDEYEAGILRFLAEHDEYRSVSL
ncbi:uncharacterized protein H6S33_007467 [Morchella sextelata]|uniref:uncharacterized protein n=1 Tax=Morchella sextelata TaxID=1174677 RepID=UPI001D05B7A9|nr:uncharacterized protein H6S33_007467 [Morchella sextelata]KAH0603808.1 hypothetical protein H6S33_007467 [Morchella sextelata]